MPGLYVAVTHKSSLCKIRTVRNVWCRRTHQKKKSCPRVCVRMSTDACASPPADERPPDADSVPVLSVVHVSGTFCLDVPNVTPTLALSLFKKPTYKPLPCAHDSYTFSLSNGKCILWDNGVFTVCACKTVADVFKVAEHVAHMFRDKGLYTDPCRIHVTNIVCVATLPRPLDLCALVDAHPTRVTYDPTSSYASARVDCPDASCVLHVFPSGKVNVVGARSIREA